MAGDPLALMETLDDGCAVTDVEWLFDQGVGYGVVMPIDLDVIVDMHAGLLPLGKLVRLGG